MYYTHILIHIYIYIAVWLSNKTTQFVKIHWKQHVVFCCCLFFLCFFNNLLALLNAWLHICNAALLLRSLHNGCAVVIHAQTHNQINRFEYVLSNMWRRWLATTSQRKPVWLLSWMVACGTTHGFHRQLQNVTCRFPLTFKCGPHIKPSVLAWNQTPILHTRQTSN